MTNLLAFLIVCFICVLAISRFSAGEDAMDKFHEEKKDFDERDIYN